MNKLIKLSLFLVFCAGIHTAPALGAETLTLNQAIEQALIKNTGLEIKNSQVREKQQRLKEMRSHYYPRLMALGTGGRATNPLDYTLSAGTIASALPSNLSPMIPPSGIPLKGHDASFMNLTAMVVQPITQILKINSGVDIADTDVNIAREERDKTRGDIQYAVKKVYYGILIAGRQKKEAELRIKLEEAQLSDAENAFASGVALPLKISGLKAGLLNRSQDLLSLENRIANLSYMLNDLTGRPLDAGVLLDDTLEASVKTQTLAQYDSHALSQSHELVIADLTLKKAGLAVDAAKKEYLPDMNLYALYNYENDFHVIKNHVGVVGVSLSWTLFDFGQKSSVLGQRKALRHQAQKNYKRIKNEVRRDIKKEYTNLQYSNQMIDLATQVVEFRKDALKIASDLDDTGLRLNTAKLEAAAELAKAEADLFAATLSNRLIRVNLAKLSGSYPTVTR
ncbi:TolC family protein [Desulfoluna sp.]|uniref:TolC family protein n=1 Tax=Desulfoluna sp. TaxID=2045199 RepID=UPI002613B0B4|nr:TolC family protein [Desulfoluna sp.]